MEDLEKHKVSIIVSIIFATLVTFIGLYFISHTLPSVDFYQNLIHGRVPNFSTIPIS